MNKYESVIIIKPDVSEDLYKKVINKVSDLIKSFSEMNENNIVVNEFGKKKLAYAIRKCEEGYYVELEFKAEPCKIRELERVYRITDEIIKFVTIRKEDE